MSNIFANMVIHRAETRGGGDFGWLLTNYSFSFAEWHNPLRMGFGMLRVLNDDQIVPGQGFGMHGHENMEIISIVLSGVLTHQDNMGNVKHLYPGQIQIMSAGTGVIHSEYNDHDDDLKLLQLWIIPNEYNVTPRYAESFCDDVVSGESLMVGPFGSAYPLQIYQNAFISKITLNADDSFKYMIKKSGHGVYFFIISGAVMINSERLGLRDAAGLWGIESVQMFSDAGAVILAIEVPMV